MNKKSIVAMVESQLAKLGFARGSYVWQPTSAELMVVAGDSIQKLKLPSGLSRRRLEYQLGRMHGWVDILMARSTRAPKGNGVHPLNGADQSETRPPA